MKKDNSARGGMMTVYGWRPGEPPKIDFNKPFFEKCRYQIYDFMTTREAVEAMLPEPLEPGPTPFAAIASIDYPAWNATDGVAHAYNEILVILECQYKGEVGLNLAYMYVGATTGDWTDSIDIAVATGRENRGFPKKNGNIFCNMIGDEWVTTVKRKGVQLINLRARYEGQMNPADVPTARYKRVMLPKEILSADFQGYDVRQLIAMELDFLGNKAEILSCRKGTASLELKGIANDRLDILKIVKPGICVDIIQNIRMPVGLPPEILATNWE